MVNIILSYIEINQHKIEIKQVGNSGVPIIIMTGMGCSFDEWHFVAESLGKINQVIMYHRPGQGESELSDDIRNTETSVNDLFQLMKQLEINEPVVIVGHSYGGLIAQHFAKLYPQKIKGLLLVDSTSVDLVELDKLELPVLNEDSTDEIWMDTCKTYSLMNNLEIKEKVKPTLTEKQGQLPKEIHNRIIDFQINPALYKAMYSEIKNWKKDAALIKSIEGTFNYPLLVIGRDKEFTIDIGVKEGFPKCELRTLEEKWEELIKNQASLSTNSELIFADQSSHSIHLDRPDIIIESIVKLVGKRNRNLKNKLGDTK